MNGTHARRLALLERLVEFRKRANLVRVLWQNELVSCGEHSDCDVEVATDEHHRGVIHLDWGAEVRVAV